MIYIAHRGNISGSNFDNENDPNYIDNAIDKGFDVEIDIFIENQKIFLGHDIPQHQIDLKWLKSRRKKLWIHCKNSEAMIFFSKIKEYHYFWHENDKMTLTSKNFIWAYPTKTPIENSIAVLPELHKTNFKSCVGICSDWVLEYKNTYS